MNVTGLTLGLVLAITLVANAQTNDEQQIRALIAKMDAGQTQGIGTKDRIFWSAAYKRPFVSPEQGEEVPSDRRISERKPGSQRNQTSPIRIEIAKSGELAYEVSNHILSFEMKDGRKVSLPASVMRVWRKEAGEWKVAAQFSHNHYQDPPPADR
jgi:ketosteroid isomerase-like protein